MAWLLLLFSAFAAFAQDADEVPLFKTGVSVVKVDVQVHDRSGVDVMGLRASDFVVFDEGQPQPILDFASEGEPVRVLMLLDVSGSMAKYLRDLGAKSTDVLRGFRAGDQIALMNFATRSELIQPLTTDTSKIGSLIIGSIYKQTLGRETLIYESVVEAAKYLRAQPGKARKAILIVTDNEGARKAVTNNDVVQALHASDAVLSAILVGSSAAPYTTTRYQNPATAPPDVFRFASDSGGQVVTGENQAEALRPVMKGLTTRYSFQYTAPPAEDGTFRRIRVELNPRTAAKYPGAVIKARSGYTVGDSGSPLSSKQ